MAILVRRFTMKPKAITMGAHLAKMAVVARHPSAKMSSRKYWSVEMDFMA